MSKKIKLLQEKINQNLNKQIINIGTQAFSFSTADQKTQTNKIISYRNEIELEIQLWKKLE